MLLTTSFESSEKKLMEKMNQKGTPSMTDSQKPIDMEASGY